MDILQRLREALADRYRVEREIGRGGMATVYQAEDLRHRRSVALKVLLPELAAAIGPERFLREIGIAARLQHPHILPLYDSGEAEGCLYYVMPFVEGESLRDPVPASLDDVLARALATDAADRYSTAAEFGDALVDAIGAGVRPGRSRGAAGLPSVAVLPFTSMSADPENEYFSEGITEEIINVLARIDGLRPRYGPGPKTAAAEEGRRTRDPMLAMRCGVWGSGNGGVYVWQRHGR